MDVSISLSGDVARFVEAEVESGRYGSPGEVVQEALRLLEERKAAALSDTLRLREAWDAGLAGGDFQPLDPDAVKAAARIRAGAGR